MADFSRYLKNTATVLFLFLMLKPVFRAVRESLSDLAFPTTRVGVVSLNGAITSAACTARHLHTLFKDPTIKAVVIKIDSPGGAAGSSQAIYEEIKAYKAKYNKPIVTFVENICASGGYYIASATDCIIATPSSFVGSIGAYIALPKAKEFINQFKLDFLVTKAGEYKAFTHPLADKPTVRQQALLTNATQDTYQQFVDDVSSSRSLLSKDKMHEWAEGKIFTGRQALALGLVDEVGAFSLVEDTVKRLAAIEGEIYWIKHPKKPGLLAKILGSSEYDDEDEDPTSFVGSCIEQLLNLLEQKYTMGIRT